MVFELFEEVRFVDNELFLFAIRAKESYVLGDLLDDSSESASTEVFGAKILFLGYWSRLPTGANQVDGLFGERDADAFGLEQLLVLEKQVVVDLGEDLLEVFAS